MAERRSRKVSTLIFLFAIFILLVAVTAAWIYRIYEEQTDYSEASTFATMECSKYYFTIEEDSVLYGNRTLYFEIENTLGAEIKTLVVQTLEERKEVIINLDQGTVQPVSLPIEIVHWVLVYPKGCEGMNFKNISFEPWINITAR